MFLNRTSCSLSSIRDAAAIGGLFAILDACDTPAVPDLARSLGDDRALSLYRGEAEEDLWAIAPYLVSIDPATLDWIRSNVWAQPWGILIVAPNGLHELRTHFRKFLFVRSPEDEKWYFRYYDPRVLAKYLPTCSAAELDQFFGPVTAFLTSSTSPDTLTRFERLAQSDAGQQSARIVRRT